MLLSACQQGAELDVSFVLVKCTAKPGVSLDECFEYECAAVGLYECESCGHLHFEDIGVSEADLWERAEEAFCDAVMLNQVIQLGCACMGLCTTALVACA